MKAKRIYIVCPVRAASEEQSETIGKHVADLERQGHVVHFPPRDTAQEDETGGVNICIENMIAVLKANEVHVWWNPTSQGSLFDLGMAFALHKPIRIINKVDRTAWKSFENVLLNWPWV